MGARSTSSSSSQRPCATACVITPGCHRNSPTASGGGHVITAIARVWVVCVREGGRLRMGARACAVRSEAAWGVRGRQGEGGSREG
eukprot:4144729-Prymnesium_polylepis.1